MKRRAPAKTGEPSPPTRAPPAAEASAGSAAATATGLLTLRTRPWARVTVDGDPYGSTPLFRVRLPVGTRTVRLVNEAKGLERTVDVEVRAGQTTKLDLDLATGQRPKSEGK